MNLWVEYACDGDALYRTKIHKPICDKTTDDDGDRHDACEGEDCDKPADDDGDSYLYRSDPCGHEHKDRDASEEGDDKAYRDTEEHDVSETEEHGCWLLTAYADTDANADCKIVNNVKM